MKSFIWFLFLMSCSSNHKIVISSFPQGAQVLVKDSSGNNRSLGKTPLEATSNEILKGNQLNSIVVSLEGYREQHLFLADGSQNYEITARLQPLLEDPKSTEAKSRQERLAQQLVGAHNLIVSKKYTEAEGILSGVSRDFPHVSVTYDLLGNVSYLRRDLGRALNYYERSLQLNPDNTETKNMVQKLRSLSSPEVRE